MPEDERGRLLERLKLLERVSDELRRELDQLRSDLLRHRGEVDETPATPIQTVGPPVVPTHPEQPPVYKPSEETVPAVASAGAPVSEDRRRNLVDLEFWLGGRGLLLLGVAALVFAVGFLVKEAVERGWIGPAFRVLLGAGVGVAAVVIGERIRAMGYRTYGLWLSAGGFAAIYLSIWAAAALFSLVSPAVGFSMMVAVVAAAAALGLLRSSESFVALAMLGGYLAPVLLSVEPASAPFSLGYLGLLSGAGLWVSYRARWIYLATVSILGGGLMPLLVHGEPHLHGSYLVVLVALALLVARRREWREVSVLAVMIGWVSYWAGSSDWMISGLMFSSYAAALWLANLIASVGVRDWRPAEAQVRPASGDVAAGERDHGLEDSERVYELSGLAVTLLPPWAFYITAMVGLGGSPYAEWRGQIGLALGLVIGAVYLAQAVFGGSGRGAASQTWRAGLGYAFLVAAPLAQWSDVALVRVWLLEGVALTAAGVLLRTVEARAAGLAAFVLATMIFWSASAVGEAAGPAFIGGWALTGLGTVAGLILWPLALVRAEKPSDWEAALRPILLSAAGLIFLGWGTQEIQRFWELLGDGEGWNLARDLSISGFWMAYAAALLTLGFRLGRPPVRWAGLAMALVAAGKVFLYDLANLAELYRIVSFVLLAIVLLGLSFRYQKLGRGEGTNTS